MDEVFRQPSTKLSPSHISTVIPTELSINRISTTIPTVRLQIPFQFLSTSRLSMDEILDQLNEEYLERLVAVDPVGRFEADKVQKSFILATSMHLTSKQMGIVDEFHGFPVHTRYHPELGLLHPDKNITIALDYDPLARLPDGDYNGLLREFMVHERDCLCSLSSFTHLMVEMLHNGADPEPTIILVVTDWENAPILEVLEGKRYRGFPIRVMRNRFVTAQALPQGQWQEAFSQDILVGSWVGNMSAGPFFEINERSGVYMLQCRHEFSYIGEPVYAPGPAALHSTIKKLKDIIILLEDAAEDGKVSSKLAYFKTGLNYLHNKILPLLRPDLTYANNPALEGIRIGTVAHMTANQDIDACLVSVRVSSKLGRALGKPMNTLIPPSKQRRQNRDINTLPTSKLSSGYQGNDVVNDYEGKTVYALGAFSGLQKLIPKEAIDHGKDKPILPHRLTITPRMAVAVFGSRTVLPRDSSAPVFDKDGTVLGIVSGFWEETLVGGFVTDYVAIRDDFAAQNIHLRVI